MAKVTVTGLTDVLSGFEGVAKKYPTEVNKFLKSEGNKLKTRVNRKRRERIKRLTGNYQEGIKRAKPYKYYKSNGGKAKDSVKVYGSKPAYHTHLIEDGHKKVLWGNRTAERVKGFYIYRDAKSDYEGVFEQNCEAFINRTLEKLL